jgi:hypothetical protein
MTRITRRQLLKVGGLGLAFLGAGCNHLWPRRDTGIGGEGHVVSETKPPEASQLVEYLNKNSSQVQSLKCESAMDCEDKKQGQKVGLTATILCQKPVVANDPPNFRLKAMAAGTSQADFGSNDKEFWYWIKQGDPAVYHCAYADMAKGNIPLPFPFQPDMVLAALGMGNYDPNKRYTVTRDDKAKTYDLIEDAVTIQGQEVQHVTRFSQNQASGTKPQVIAHILRDKQGKEIYTATVLEVQRNKGSADVPTKVKLVWPPQQLEMTMRLYDVELNSIDPKNPGQKFVRPKIAQCQDINLAQFAEAKPTGIEQVGMPPSK